MIQVITPAASFDLSAAPTLFELWRGGVRLRPHNDIDAAARCACAASFNVDPANASDLVTAVRDYVTGAYLTHNYGAGASLATGTWGGRGVDMYGSSVTRSYQPGDFADMMNLTEFTGAIVFTLNAAIATLSSLFSELTAVNGLRRWAVTISNTSKIITLNVYNSADGVTAHSVTVAGGAALTAGVTYVLYCGYSKSAHKMFLNIYKSDGTAIATAAEKTVGVPDINIANTDPNQYPALATTGGRNAAGQVAGGSDINLIEFQVYEKYINPATLNFFPAGPVALFAATQSGATVLLDAGADDAEWDSSTATVDDLAQWAAAFGGPGYSLTYECANVLAGAWSAGLSLSDFQALGTLTGRYLKFSLVCVSDGLTNYMVRWMGCEFEPAATPCPVPPATPTLISYSRVDAAGIAIIGGVAAGNTAHVYAYSILDSDPVILELVGSAVSVGGNTTVVLDYTGWTGTIFGATIPLPEMAFAVAENAGLFSLPSSAHGELLDLIWTVDISTVVWTPGHLSADVTITGLPAGEHGILMWFDLAGNIHAHPVVGSGTYTVPGLELLATFSPSLMCFSSAARIAGLAGFCEQLASLSRPHSYVKKAFHSHEVT